MAVEWREENEDCDTPPMLLLAAPPGVLWRIRTGVGLAGVELREEGVRAGENTSLLQLLTLLLFGISFFSFLHGLLLGES